MTRRRRWLLIHRVNGLLLTVFVVVVGLTGSLLAWNAQLERIFAPRLFVLPPHPADAVRADPLWVREQVVKAFPWAEVESVDLSMRPGDPLEYSLAAKGNDRRDDDAFADPYSGQVLGSRRYGDLHQGWVNLMPFVYTLHQSLALGDFGVTLLGLAAVLWTLDCFVGMYLTFPASQRRAIPFFGDRVREWPARWRGSWMIRWRSGSFKRLYDLHRASALWLWGFLLVFAWTGVAFNLPGVYRPVMHLVGAKNASAQPGGSCAVEAVDAGPSWATVLNEARVEMRKEATERGFQVLSERFLSYEPETCRWTYRARSTLDVDRIGNTQLVWIGSNSAQAVFSAATGETKADTFTTWIEAIHESQIGGTGFRMLVCLGGLVSALLAVTGVWIFLRKMRRGIVP